MGEDQPAPAAFDSSADYRHLRGSMSAKNVAARLAGWKHSSFFLHGTMGESARIRTRSHIATLVLRRNELDGEDSRILFTGVSLAERVALVGNCDRYPFSSERRIPPRDLVVSHFAARIHRFL